MFLSVKRITDDLDAAGNIAKTITKGFAIGVAGLTIALLVALQEGVRNAIGKVVGFDLINPLVLVVVKQES